MRKNSAVKHCGHMNRRVQNILIVFIYVRRRTQNDRERKHGYVTKFRQRKTKQKKQTFFTFFLLNIQVFFS